MADKSVGELIAAQSVTPTDLFVLEQNGTAKKLTGQVLLNWLTAAADGHGGIQSIAKVSTSGLVDTYRITLADTTTFDFYVTNGRNVVSVQKTGTSGLVDTYTISYNDNTSETFTVTNGEKGDKGDNQYVWIKYASQKPTATSHSMGDVADNWIGIYSGASSTAPTDWQQYEWFQIKGEKGETGAAATLISSVVEYQVSDSGTIIPSGAWSASVPVVAQGKYLWTRATNNFNTGSPVISYSVSRMGLDGSGSVSSVADISPDGNGNVPLTAADIGALPNSGGDMTGELNMNGQPISGLNAPTANDQAANMGFVNQKVKKAAPRNLLDNSDFRNPVNQRGQTNYSDSGYTIDRWTKESNALVQINQGSITIDNSNNTISETFIQKTDESTAKAIIGKTITVAVCLEDGTIHCNSGVVTYDTPVAQVHFNSCSAMLHFFQGASNYQMFRLVINQGATVALKWAAVYEGAYTAETLPPYVPKGYGVELAECKRYYQQYGNRWVSLDLNTEGFGIQSVILPVPMRVIPTANFQHNSEAVFDVFGEAQKTLLYEYFTTFESIIYLAVKAPAYPDKWITAMHTLTLTADL